MACGQSTKHTISLDCFTAHHVKTHRGIVLKTLQPREFKISRYHKVTLQ
jgi:hypothetical protein